MCLYSRTASRKETGVKLKTVDYPLLYTHEHTHTTDSRDKATSVINFATPFFETLFTALTASLSPALVAHTGTFTNLCLE